MTVYCRRKDNACLFLILFLLVHSLRAVVRATKISSCIICFSLFLSLVSSSGQYNNLQKYGRLGEVVLREQQTVRNCE